MTLHWWTRKAFEQHWHRLQIQIQMQIQLQPANPPGLFRHHGEESTKVNSTSYAQQGCRPWGCWGVPWYPQILADQLTLSQPGVTDYAHLITTGPNRHPQIF